ncbi:hypothetical protein SLA2020_205540 [Shorea laevis]
MEAYSSYTFSSSTTRQEKEAHSSLHSVRRPSMKPSKKPIEPQRPTAPRVYKVEPVNFRGLVQKLTGAPKFRSQPQRLLSVAPPPVTVAASSPLFGSDIAVSPLQFFSSPLETKSQKWSPSSNDWFSFPILSPGTLSSLGQSTGP